jgi:predicted nucleic acid-binding protein
MLSSDYIVSGDADLLALGTYDGIRILDPAQAEAEIDAELTRR